MSATVVTPAVSTPPSGGLLGWRWPLAITLMLLLLRLIALRHSPLELYPDEAQYWVWSRTLAFGYFSKPPMIAWLIRATTAMFGDAEPFVRLSSPVLHAAAGLFLYAAGRRLDGAAVGLVGLLLYNLMPGVQLGAFVVSADTPLVAFLAAALWLYAMLQSAQGRAKVLAAAGFGLALGLAFLAKYAAVYAVIGVALHLIIERSARRAWTWPAVLAAAAGLALCLAPNLAWNAAHRFATVNATAGNAGWDTSRHFNILELLSFIGAQFGVFGPGPFAFLVGGAAVLAVRKRLEPADRLLLCLTAPPLVIVSIQAFIVEAHANWAAAAYAPASISVAAWLLRWRARWLTGATIAFQGLIAAAFLVGVIQPKLADAVHLNALKRMRGWREMTQQFVQQGQVEQLSGPLTAAATDDRFFFNEALYYGRDYFGRQGPALRMWTDGVAHNQAEMDAPLTSAQSGRVLMGLINDTQTTRIMGRFTRADDLAIVDIRLDARDSRRLDMFVGEGLIPPAAAFAQKSPPPPGRAPA